MHVCLHHRQHISYSLEQRGREKWVLSKHFRFFIYINIKYQLLIYLLCSFLMVSNLLATLLKMLMMMTLTLMMVVFIFFRVSKWPNPQMSPPGFVASATVLKGSVYQTSAFNYFVAIKKRTNIRENIIAHKQRKK